MMRALIFCLALLAGPLQAQTLPALYNVSGVAENDTLNVRTGPGTDHEVIGKLPPDATDIEVVDINGDGDWGLINIGDRAGWVALRYMTRGPGQPETGLPRGLSCAGTEPFWSFSLLSDGKAEFARPEEETVTFGSIQTVTSANRTDRHALFADGGSMVVTAMIGRNSCSDGMSDRAYGLGIDLLVTDKAEVHVYSGCCSVAP